MYQWIIAKRRLEAIIIFPFVVLGKLIAYMRPLKKEYDLFFFFPFFHVGGAEKVHSEITRQFADKRIAVFFTRKSINDAMLPLFKGANITIYDISAHTDNKWLYWRNLIYRGIVSTYINRQQRTPVILNGQCNFAYKLSPHVKKNIRQVELIHSFCSFSYIRIPFLPFYERTVMISQDAIHKHIELYRRYHIPAAFVSRIQLIMNGIPLPSADTLSLQDDKVRLLYVGRATAEKRPHLVAEIARAAGVEAGFIGSVAQSIPEDLHKYCVFYGEQTNSQVIDKLYRSHRVIVITSSTEGFPMVIMEAMARGLAVLSTNVGDIPYHVREGGFLMEADQPESGIVEEGAKLVAKWIADPALLQHMGKINIAYAHAHFGLDKFAAAWRSLLL